jgi:hypothetical protein
MSSFHTVVELKGALPMTIMMKQEQVGCMENFKAWSS